MHPRIIMVALAGVAFDLLCVAAAATVLLSNNQWLADVGIARFWLVVLIVAIGLVPVMYGFERESVARELGQEPENVGRSLPAWAGVDRSVRTA